MTTKKKKIERAKITSAKRAKIIGAIRRGNDSGDIAESFGISEGSVFRIRRQALAAAGINVKGVRVTPEYAAQALAKRAGRTAPPKPRKPTREALPLDVVAAAQSANESLGDKLANLRAENAALRALLKNLL